MTLLKKVWAAVKNGSWAPIAGTAITAAVSFGFLTAEQATVGNAIVSSVATFLAALVAVVHTVRGVKLASK